MKYSDISIKGIGQPYKAETGIYGLTAVIFINTYFTATNLSFSGGLKIDFTTITELLATYIISLHLLPFVLLFVILLIKAIVVYLSDTIFKKDLYKLKFFSDLKKSDGYYSIETIKNLSIHTNNSILTILIEESKNEEKKFKNIQKALLSLSFLTPINFYYHGFLYKITSIVELETAYVFGGFSVLFLILISTSQRDFKVRLNKSIIEELMKKSDFKRVSNF